MALSFFLFNLTYFKSSIFNGIQHFFNVIFVSEFFLHPIQLVELSFEQCIPDAQLCSNAPIFRRNKSRNFILAVHNNLHGNRLHAAG
ncbi:hypothetical protein D3C75_925850 [compost metagenome]